jgi:hypothetical protein
LVDRTNAGWPLALPTLAPTIRPLQTAGNTMLQALAAGLNAMGITTARGGSWDQTQVRRLLARI